MQGIILLSNTRYTPFPNKWTVINKTVGGAERAGMGFENIMLFCDAWRYLSTSSHIVNYMSTL